MSRSLSVSRGISSRVRTALRANGCSASPSARRRAPPATTGRRRPPRRPAAFAPGRRGRGSRGSSRRSLRENARIGWVHGLLLLAIPDAPPRLRSRPAVPRVQRRGMRRSGRRAKRCAATAPRAEARTTRPRRRRTAGGRPPQRAPHHQRQAGEPQDQRRPSPVRSCGPLLDHGRRAPPCRAAIIAPPHGVRYRRIPATVGCTSACGSGSARLHGRLALMPSPIGRATGPAVLPLGVQSVARRRR